MTPRTVATGQSLFAADPSKAYFERFALSWAPISLFGLLVGVFASGLYVHCGRREYLAFSVAACLPGFIWPVLFPCDHDANRPYSERFWVKAAVWIAIFSFYGNYFWTHYFYTLLGAQYLFDSYALNDVPLVCYLCTYFYFTFYFALVNVVLRAISRTLRRLTLPTSNTLTKLARNGIWVFAVVLLAVLTAVFEAVSVQHFPLYTYKDHVAFLTTGSVFYGIYFMIGFPMFFRIDECLQVTALSHADRVSTEHTFVQQSIASRDKSPNNVTQGVLNTCARDSLWQVAQNALAAVAIVTLLLDLWRLFLGDIYGSGSESFVPFIYRT